MEFRISYAVVVVLILILLVYVAKAYNKKEHLEEEAINHLCINGGVPVSSGEPHEWDCKCPDGFFGKHCEQKKTCVNGGKMTHRNVCDCLQGFYGQYCEKKVPMCPNQNICGPGCKRDGHVCKGGRFGCDNCHGIGCCTKSWTGCGAGQFPRCVDHNKSHYPCQCGARGIGATMVEGGVMASPEQLRLMDI